MTETREMTTVQAINAEINRELADEGTKRALVATTFKDLSEGLMKQAIVEGMIRGFTFKNFLQRDIYAIKYGSGYSLMTSIDWARKTGAKSGVVGKEAPVFRENEKGNLISGSVTIKKKFGSYVGDFTAEVYFSEYTTGRSLWVSKPRTMLAKVAEMHALRMACPEELAQSYIEEEMNEDKFDDVVETSNIRMGNMRKQKNAKENNEEDEAYGETAEGVEGEIVG